jgi:hypothetical protein
MSKASRIAGAILAAGMASGGPSAAMAAETSALTPEPVAKAVGDVLVQTSDGEIAGFRWGSPVSTLASSKQVRPSPNISVKCSADIASAERADCTAFVPTAKNTFARAYYATSRDGLLMVESNATRFDCARFDEMASPSAGHRQVLAAHGWNYLRRDRRPEGAGAIVETQWFARNGIGVEFTFIKAAQAGACGVKSFVSKVL